MNNSASSIRSAISTKLTELVPGTLKQVVIGRRADPSGFPFCRFYLVGIDDELKDNTPSNWRNYQFQIDIQQECVAKDISTAEANFEDAIDAVLDKLNSQWTLAGNVDVSVVQSGTITSIENPQGISLSISILLSCKTLIS